MAKGGDSDGDANGLEATKVGVGEVSADEGSDVDPERVEGRQGSGGTLTEAEGTWVAFCRGISTSVATDCVIGSWPLEEVLEDLCAAIVRETFCEFAKRDPESHDGDRFRDAAESVTLILGGVFDLVDGSIAAVFEFFQLDFAHGNGERVADVCLGVLVAVGAHLGDGSLAERRILVNS